MAGIEFQFLPIDTDLSFIQVRSVKYWGVERLKKSMQDRGFLDGKPVEVARVNGGLRLFEGRHRWEAAKLVDDIRQIPALIHEELSDEEQYRRAFMANDAAEDAVPKTFMDDAEMIWGRLHDGWTQEKVAETFGWTREKVSKFAQLERICPEARQVIGTTLDELCTTYQDGDVPLNGTPVPRSLFSEGVLRSIIHLTPDQQLKLVRQVIKDGDKAKFKSEAEYLHAENDMVLEAERQLKGLPAEYITQAITEIRKGLYGKEYRGNGNKPGPAFLKLLQSLKDAHQGTQNYRCVAGDFREVGQELEPDSIDIILTDPPYGRDWVEEFDALGDLAARVLKPGGSLLVMYGQSFLYEAHARLAKYLSYHWTIAYLTPGGQSVGIWAKEVNTFWKPVLWFIKGKYQGKWEGDVAQSAVNDDDKRFHQWGQSESGMASLVERFTTQGEIILDPCMGAGTTGVAALSRRRKFIGFDRDVSSVEQATIRLQATAEQLASLTE